MNRRRFLSAAALSTSLCGCLESGFGETTESPAPGSEATDTEPSEKVVTETGTSTPAGATPDCWPSMCEGTKLVEVVVARDFSGEVLLAPGCRSDEFSIRPGGSVRIDRAEDAETCEIELYVEGVRAFGETIEGYESVTLTVDSDGQVHDEWVVY